MIKVTFKDEGGVGPVQVIDTVAYAADPVVKPGSPFIPFGYKPQGVTDLGWLNRGRGDASRRDPRCRTGGVMRVRVSYVVDVDDDFRREINRWYGQPGLATREEVKKWFEANGHSMNDDLAMQAADHEEES